MNYERLNRIEKKYKKKKYAKAKKDYEKAKLERKKANIKKLKKDTESDTSKKVKKYGKQGLEVIKTSVKNYRAKKKRSPAERVFGK